MYRYTDFCEMPECSYDFDAFERDLIKNLKLSLANEIQANRKDEVDFIVRILLKIADLHINNEELLHYAKLEYDQDFRDVNVLITLMID